MKATKLACHIIAIGQEKLYTCRKLNNDLQISMDGDDLHGRWIRSAGMTWKVLQYRKKYRRNMITSIGSIIDLREDDAQTRIKREIWVERERACLGGFLYI